MDYIEANMALTMNVLTSIDLLKLNLSSKLKVYSLTLDTTECYNVVYEGDDGHPLVGELRQEQAVKQTVNHKLRREVTGTTYSRLTARLIKEINIDRLTLSTLHLLTKDRPKINSSVYLSNTDTDNSNTATATATATAVGKTDILKCIDNRNRNIKKTKNMNDVKMVAKILV